jgi:hypothetical protein
MEDYWNSHVNMQLAVLQPISEKYGQRHTDAITSLLNSKHPNATCIGQINDIHMTRIGQINDIHMTRITPFHLAKMFTSVWFRPIGIQNVCQLCRQCA